ncbi:hypothetical protein MSAN_00098200 [Mycena sanguinolenta]|uniref:Uncharacterized protein n=1 Tax=Mycena sanguinolenta TaxID=230812 RepID=A0A8H6ZD79_9AGAR|nr:hypothetical protein MSAN_00098200 [Mycena sanguinolenta]
MRTWNSFGTSQLQDKLKQFCGLRRSATRLASLNTADAPRHSRTSPSSNARHVFVIACSIARVRQRLASPLSTPRQLCGHTPIRNCPADVALAPPRTIHVLYRASRQRLRQSHRWSMIPRPIYNPPTHLSTTKANIRYYLPPHGPAPTPNAPTTRRRIQAPQLWTSRCPTPDRRLVKNTTQCKGSYWCSLTSSCIRARDSTIRFVILPPNGRASPLDAVGRAVLDNELGTRAACTPRYVLPDPVRLTDSKARFLRSHPHDHLRIGARSYRPKERSARWSWDRDHGERPKRVRRAQTRSRASSSRELDDSRRFGSGRDDVTSRGVRQYALPVPAEPRVRCGAVRVRIYNCIVPGWDDTISVAADRSGFGFSMSSRSACARRASSSFPGKTAAAT